MTTDEKLCVREEDAIRLILEFLSRRDLCITQLNLERESGIYNCHFSDDLIFLRQLILDGQWDDALQFVSPLESFETFAGQRFRFIIYKHKYVELLCIRCEAGSPYQTVEVAVQDIIECLDRLEKYCSNRDEYNHLSSLLTIPNLNDDDELKNWNPNSWRLKCFKDILPLVEKFMSIDDEVKSKQIAKNDRLMDLIFKGLLYEVCLYTVTKRNKCSTERKTNDSFEPDVFNGINEKINLSNLIQYLPDKYFIDSQTTEPILDITKHHKPVLVASWSEMILSAPIKPKVFPHIDVPYTRIKAADLMSKSLSASLMHYANTKDLMTMSVCDIAQFSSSTLATTGFRLDIEKNTDQNYINQTIKDCDNSKMNKTIDRLFQSNQEQIFYNSKNNHGESNKKMPPIIEKVTTPCDDMIVDQTMATDNINNDDSMMNISYFKIWKNFQKEKSKLISKIENRSSLKKQQQQPPSPQTSSTTAITLALKNRVESNKLARSSSIKSSCAKDDTSQITIATNEQFNRFTTPVSKGNKLIIKNPPMTSTPKSNHQHYQIKPVLIEDGQDEQQQLFFNSQPSISDKSSSTTTMKSAATLNQKFNNLKHGIRSSPIPSSSSSSNYYSHGSHQFDLSSINNNVDNNNDPVHFIPITKIRDLQAIRTAEFHPIGGKYFAVGSNSKLLRVFQYASSPSSLNNNDNDNRSNKSNRSNLLELMESEEIYVRTNYHKGSIYCLTWNKLGNLLATGSNDKTVKILPFNQETVKFSANEIELSIHDGTVRDLCFMDDLSNGSSLLLSGGAGDCKIYITDCEMATTFLSLSGHSGPILSMYTWGGAMFVSGSQDRTIRFWDLRSNSCINFVTCPTISRNKPGGAVAAVCVDPSGKLLVSGHEDSTCMLYDIRGGRVIQTFHPHSADIRTIRFSNKAYYLLTGGYDNNIALTDLQGDLTQPLESILVASHQDKVIQCRWHPNEFTFLSTSADKSVMLWTLPD